MKKNYGFGPDIDFAEVIRDLADEAGLTEDQTRHFLALLWNAPIGGILKEAQRTHG